MEFTVHKCTLEEIKSFRILFLHENHFQFVYDKCHYYGWADTYVFLVDGVKIGYGAVWGKDKREDRDAIMEFFVIKTFRHLSDVLFQQFILVSAAIFIECQSNDLLLSEMLYRYAENIHAEAVLFEDHHQTNFTIPGVILQRNQAGDNPNDVGGYFLQQNNETVATGGFMLNYNIPYADIYMDVNENFRQKGYGSFIIQELKKKIYLMGRIPAARCNMNNLASKASLIKAGFRVCGFRLNGNIKTNRVN